MDSGYSTSLSNPSRTCIWFSMADKTCEIYHIYCWTARPSDLDRRRQGTLVEQHFWDENRPLCWQECEHRLQLSLEPALTFQPCRRLLQPLPRMWYLLNCRQLCLYLPSSLTITTICKFFFFPSYVAVLSDSKRSNLRFVIPQPPTIIYTADFNIMPNYISKPPASEAQANLSAPRQAIVTVTSTITSRISGSQQAVEPSSTTSISAGTFWALGNRRHQIGSVDIEKLKFRLLFVVWPSLVGLSLAL